jgi:hypothetical protein
MKKAIEYPPLPEDFVWSLGESISGPCWYHKHVKLALLESNAHEMIVLCNEAIAAWMDQDFEANDLQASFFGAAWVELRREFKKEIDDGHE